MELISKEKLRDRMYHEAFEVDSEMQKWESGCWIRYKLFEKILDEVPTAESRPTGEWIIERGCEEVIVICSNCGAKDYIPTTIDGRFYFNRNYCWDCGSDMREDKICTE